MKIEQLLNEIKCYPCQDFWVTLAGICFHMKISGLKSRIRPLGISPYQLIT